MKIPDMVLPFIAMAVGVVIAVLLGFACLPLVPSQYSLAYWLLIGIGLIPANFLWLGPFFPELETGDFNFASILITDALATEIVFAGEGVVITFLYGDLVWGFISLAIAVASALLFYKNWKLTSFGLYDMLIPIPSSALGVIFGILSGGGLACVLPILFLAVFCSLLLQKWFIFGGRPHEGPYDHWTEEDYERIRKQS